MLNHKFQVEIFKFNLKIKYSYQREKIPCISAAGFLPKNCILFFLVLNIVFSIPTFALNSIAIAPFKNNNQISKILTSKITELNKFDVISQKEINDKRQLVKINEEELTDPLKILDLGRILNTGLIIFGSYSEIEDTVKISIQVIDVTNGVVNKTFQVTGLKNELENILNRLCLKLFSPENYFYTAGEYFKIKKMPPEKIAIKEDNFFIPEDTLEKSSVNNITFKNFITYKTNFIPFFWLDNNIEIIGRIIEKNGESIGIFNSNSGNSDTISGTFSPYEIKSISISPDKKKIAYESNGDLFVLNFDGSDRKKVDFGLKPSWSPNSKKISYIKGVPPRIFHVNADDVDDPIEITSGSITAWFPSGKEIVLDCNYEKLDTTLNKLIIDTKVSHEITGQEAFNYYFLFSSNSFSGPRIPLFAKRNWLIKKADRNRLEIIDISAGEREIIKIKGKPFEVKAEYISWSKDGKRLIFLDHNNENINIAEIGLKEKTYFKLNVGAQDGLSVNDRIHIVYLDGRESPKKGKIYSYTEKKIGIASIVRIYPKVSIAVVPRYEQSLGKDKVVKYILPNGVEMEGAIMYYDDEIISFLDNSKSKASEILEMANKVFDEGKFDKTQELLKQIIDIYPETAYYKNAKDMIKLLPTKKQFEE